MKTLRHRYDFLVVITDLQRHWISSMANSVSHALQTAILSKEVLDFFTHIILLKSFTSVLLVEDDCNILEGCIALPVHLYTPAKITETNNSVIIKTYTYIFLLSYSHKKF